jgi:peptidoglycan lytic transglycosylase
MRQRTGFRLAHVPFQSLLLAALLLCHLLAAGCSNHRKPSPASSSLGVPVERGIASWYGPKFHGRRTANGERYDMNQLTAAHPSLPFGTLVGVRNTRTGREVVVRINDRGPFAHNRVIDLSYAAAQVVGVVGPGTASVELYLVPATGQAPRYTVQVGAFSEAERAAALLREMARIYPEAVVDSDGTWNRVQIGAFHDRDQAEALRRELAVVGVSSIVVSAR